jgi:hypothetical protein
VIVTDAEYDEIIEDLAEDAWDEGDVSSLSQLAQRCNASSASAVGRRLQADAWITACVAATEICGLAYGAEEADWEDALRALQQELIDLRYQRRQRIVGDSLKGQPWTPALVAQLSQCDQEAEQELVERINGAIRRWNDRIAEEAERTAAGEVTPAAQSPSTTQESDMATATAGKRKAQKLTVLAWKDPTGVEQWLCPRCRNLHALIQKACGCGFCRPAIEQLKISHDLVPPRADNLDAEPVSAPPAVDPPGISYTEWLLRVQTQSGCSDGVLRATNDALLTLFNEGGSIEEAVELVRPAVPETQDEAREKEEAASGNFETINLVFSPAAKYSARIDLQEHEGVWRDRISRKHAWLKRGSNGKLAVALGMTEQFGEHVVGQQTSRAATIACALDRLRESMEGVAAEFMTPAGIKARPIALAELASERVRLLGEAANSTTPAKLGVFEARTVLVRAIKFRSDNPRGTLDQANVERLAKSIGEQGLQAPVGLRHNGDGSYEGWYGAHRFAAVCFLGRVEILANVYPVGTPNEVMRSLRADDNLAHGDLHPIARAMHYREKLLAAGWQPDSEASAAEGGTGKTGPSLRSLAQSIGVSQGELSNQLGLLKLPADWQQRLIGREITPTQGRMLIPWIERPVVLAAVAKRLKGFRGRELTTDQFARELRGAISDVTRPARPDAWLRGCVPGTYQSRRVLLTEKQITAHAAELDLVEVAEGKRKERVAFNTQLFDRLQAEAEQAAAKRQAKKRDAGDGKREKAAPTPAEQKARAKEQAEQLAKRVARYKTRRLQQAASKRAETVEGHLGTKLLLYFAAMDDSRRGREVGDVVKDLGGKLSECSFGYCRIIDAWKSLSTLTGPQFVAAAREFLARRLTADTESSRAGLRAEDLPAIAAELGVVFEQEWRCDEEFLRLFTRDQLAELVSEWKIVLLPAKTRDDLIQSILTHQTNRGKPLSVPKILAKVK